MGKISAIILAVALLLGCAKQAPERIYIASSSKYLFAYDERGQIKWRAPKGIGSYGTASSKEAVSLIFPRTIKTFDIASGRLLWGKTFPDTIWRWGNTKQMLRIQTAKEEVLLDFKTGEIKEKKELKVERKIFTGGVCPLATPGVRTSEEEIVTGTSSKYLFGFDADGNIKWKARLKEKSCGAVGSSDFICLTSKRRIRVFNKRSGILLWEKKFPEDVQSFSLSGTAVIIKLPDKTLKFEVTSGELVKEEN